MTMQEFLCTRLSYCTFGYKKLGNLVDLVSPSPRSQRNLAGVERHVSTLDSLRRQCLERTQVL